MWVKVQDEIEFPRREAIAQVTREMAVNAGLGPNIFKVLTAPEFSEEFVRKLLAPHYQNVSRWQLHAVAYNIEAGAIDVLVSAADFPESRPGEKRLYLYSQPVRAQA